ncbi:MAG: winged helix-turn-helix domain-containing protein [Nitrososphaerales archaeon]
MKILDEDAKDRVIRALSDRYSRIIVFSTIEKARSAIDLSQETNIPISTVYRRIHELQQAGLIVAERSVLSEDGKRYELYRSTIKVIKVNFGSNSVEVEVIPNEDVIGKFLRLWSEIKGASKNLIFL